MPNGSLDLAPIKPIPRVITFQSDITTGTSLPVSKLRFLPAGPAVLDIAGCICYIC